MTIKPQPQHPAADLARTATVPPGAPSPTGQAILTGRSSLTFRILLGPLRPILAEPTPAGRARRRWRA